MMTAIEILTLACLPAFVLLDRLLPGRRFREPRHWKRRALAVTLFVFAFTTLVTIAWAGLLGDWHLLDLSRLGVLGGAALGFLVVQLIQYAYHRSVHANDFLWRHFHQMHHSAESMDALGAYYLHPLDAFFFTTWASLVFYPLLGLDTGAGIVGNFALTFCAVFQHSRIVTPRWLGYIVQRPESHCLHHERGRHRYNYADLPLIDMLFGTFRNPSTFAGEAGFYDGASARIGDLLLGKDVSVAPGQTEALEPASETASAA